MPKTVISLVAWNGMKYLPDCLASVRAQTHGDFTLVVVDNGSSDGTADYVRQEFPQATILRNTRNLGFAKGHNQAIQYARTHLRPDEGDLFVLVLNQDVVLDERFLERMLERVAHRSDIGSACGKMLRMHETFDGDFRDCEFSDVIDSTGLEVRRSRQVVDRNAGETDDEGFERTGEVFGPSGATALYRLSALEDVAVSGEFFDEDFFAYKEDIDLAWRLRLRGWRSLYVPAARGWHFRGLAPERAGLLRSLLARRRRSGKLSRMSYRNHLLTLVKNEQVGNVLRDLPRIAVREMGRAAFVTLFEPRTAAALPDFLRALPKALRKRRRIMGSARAEAKEIRKWFA